MRAEMEISKINVSFGTNFKIPKSLNEELSNDVSLKNFIAGAQAAKGALAENGINDTLHLRYTNTPLVYSGGPPYGQPTIIQRKPFFTLDKGIINSLFNNKSIDKDADSPEFKTAEGAKRWILDTYNKIFAPKK